MTPINLIPAGRRAASADRRRMVRWSIGVGVYAAAVLIGCVVIRVAQDQPGATHEAEMRLAVDRIEQSAMASKVYAKEIASLRRQLDAAVTVGRHPDWSLLLGALARARGEAVVLDSIELSPVKAEAEGTPAKDAAKDKAKTSAPAKPVKRAGATYLMRLSGFSRTAPGVFEFAQALEAFGPLEHVTIVKTQSSRVGTLDVTGFELTAMIADKPREPAGGEKSK